MIPTWSLHTPSKHKNTLIITSWLTQLYLVGGFAHIEKYESQLGSLFPTYGRIKAMFHQTDIAEPNFPFIHGKGPKSQIHPHPQGNYGSHGSLKPSEFSW